MLKKWILWILLATLYGCDASENTLPQQEGDTQTVELTTGILGFSGVSLPGISTQIQKISVLLFDHNTQLFYKGIDFDVIDTSYVVQIPIGVWDLILVGSGDNMLPDFATSPVAHSTRLTDPMLAPPLSGGNYGSLREYFYAHQVCNVLSSTTTLPKMTLKRIVSKLSLQTDSRLADSLARVQITLKNVVASVNFLGTPSATYMDETINKTTADKTNGVYSFTFYTLGSKPLGSNPAINFMVDMLYVRGSIPLTPFHFYMFSPADFQAGGLVVNTSTNINLGI